MFTLGIYKILRYKKLGIIPLKAQTSQKRDEMYHTSVQNEQCAIILCTLILDMLSKNGVATFPFKNGGDVYPTY